MEEPEGPIPVEEVAARYTSSPIRLPAPRVPSNIRIFRSTAETLPEAEAVEVVFS